VRDQVVQAGIIMVGHRVLSFSVSAFAGLTKAHAMAHLTGGPPPLLPPPHGTPTPAWAQREMELES
jgi:hypothetical protein